MQLLQKYYVHKCTNQNPKPMNKSLLFLFLITIASAGLAQDCNLFIPLIENKGMQYQSFNRRDRLEGTQDVMIKTVTRHGDHTEALISTKYYDSRERFQHEAEYTIRCKGDELIIDIQSMLDQAMLAGFKDMEITMTTVDISLPSRMEPGDLLPEARVEMTVRSAGTTISEITFITRNRKVEAIETITTPAGTFECYKISYEAFTETRTMGIPFRVTAKGFEYYAQGIGNVRSEFYDDRDRLQSYQVLSRLYQ